MEALKVANVQSGIANAMNLHFIDQNCDRKSITSYIKKYKKKSEHFSCSTRCDRGID